MKKLLLPFFAFAMFIIPSLAQAEVVHSTVGVQGYDLTSYHTGSKPLPGNGNHVVMHEGVNYLFANDANRQAFEKNPTKYLPAYGGYCAYGVSVGKKFIGDPNVWEIVDGQLYLNLDNKIKGIWSKDISGNISKANANWPEIKNKAPSEL
ncbi:MAG: YHS domain-containing (seleno)protein [Alphaproteobacteria bacterium]